MATINGFEVMRTLKKKQAKVFPNLERDLGKALVLECAFGNGPEGINVIMSLQRETLGQIAIDDRF